MHFIKEANGRGDRIEFVPLTLCQCAESSSGFLMIENPLYTGLRCALELRPQRLDSFRDYVAFHELENGYNTVFHQTD